MRDINKIQAHYISAVQALLKDWDSGIQKEDQALKVKFEEYSIERASQIEILKEKLRSLEEQKDKLTKELKHKMQQATTHTASDRPADFEAITDLKKQIENIDLYIEAILTSREPLARSYIGAIYVAAQSKWEVSGGMVLWLDNILKSLDDFEKEIDKLYKVIQEYKYQAQNQARTSLNLVNKYKNLEPETVSEALKRSEKEKQEATARAAAIAKQNARYAQWDAEEAARKAASEPAEGDTRWSWNSEKGCSFEEIFHDGQYVPTGRRKH